MTGESDFSGGTLEPAEAEELLHEAGQNINRVIVEYPELTDELVSLLRLSRKANAYAYFRIGREDSTPALAELADMQDWDDPLKEVVQDA